MSDRTKQRVKKRYRQKRTMKRIQNAIQWRNHRLNTIVRDEATTITREQWEIWASRFDSTNNPVSE